MEAIASVDLVLNSEKSFVNTEHPGFWKHNFYLRGKGGMGQLPGMSTANDDEDEAEATGPHLPKEWRSVAEEGNKFSGTVKR